METHKVITLLWSVAIPATIVMVLLLLVKTKKETIKYVSHKIFTLSNVISFISLFCWISILLLNLFESITNVTTFAFVGSLLFTILLNSIKFSDETMG